MEAQLVPQPALAHLLGRAYPGLDTVRGDDGQRRLAAHHTGAGEQAGQTIAVVAMHMGDENRTQVVQRQRRTQQAVLGALAAIDQVPAFAGVFQEGQPADIAGLGGGAGGGAEK